MTRFMSMTAIALAALKSFMSTVKAVRCLTCAIYPLEKYQRKWTDLMILVIYRPNKLAVQKR